MTRLHLPAEATPAEFSKTIASAEAADAQPEDVAVLAEHLAASGELLQWEDGPPVGDIASTGGPGSLSTILAPLWLRAEGFRIAKLAVPGRPAGAIDTFGTVAGYKVNLETKQVYDAVKSCGFAHFLADHRFAPLDASLFQYRKENDKVAIRALTAASILSKKVAVGASCVGLDIRVGAHGNFGATHEDARRNASLFCKAAETLGIRAVAFLTRQGNPPQPLIGRGESLLGLAHALDLRSALGPDTWLDEHAADCRDMAQILRTSIEDERLGDRTTPPSSKDAEQVLRVHLEEQNSSMDAFLGRVDEVLAADRNPLYAGAAGTFHLDLARLRATIVERQANQPRDGFIDGGGVILCERPSATVSEGDLLALVRTGAPEDTGLVKDVDAAFHIESNPSVQHSRIHSSIEVINA